MPVIARNHHDLAAGLTVRYDVQDGTGLIKDHRGGELPIRDTEYANSLIVLLAHYVLDATGKVPRIENRPQGGLGVRLDGESVPKRKGDGFIEKYASMEGSDGE